MKRTVFTILLLASLALAGCDVSALATQVAQVPTPSAQATPAGGAAAAPTGATSGTAATGAPIAGGAASNASSSSAAGTPPAAAATPVITNPTSSAAPGAPSGPLATLEATLTKIYNDIGPSVVTIEVLTQVTNAPFFGGGQQQQAALGTGWLYDSAGHIVTNNHVIEGASQISVVFQDGTTVAGRVVGADPQSDLAVVQVSLPSNQIKPLTIADSTKVKVGQLAIAIGNPFGERSTMSLGIVSALSRSLPVEAGATQTGGAYSIPDVIQTDAAINPGNSGGPLLDASGHVIGVTSAIESPSGTSAGVGFAIPSALVQRVVPALIKNGSYQHPWLGISGATLTPPLARAMNLPATQRGALVITVTANGPSAKGGLRGSSGQANVGGQPAPIGGDVITAVDGQPVRSFDDLVAYLARNASVGQTLTVQIVRDGQQQTLRITLGARPISQPSNEG